MFAPWLSHWLRFWSRKVRPSARRSSVKLSHRPLVEGLEDRTLLSAVLVSDINARDPLGGPKLLTDFNGALYFVASDSAHGNELWKTDGSDAGTQLVVDLAPGPDGSGISGLTAAASSSLFIATQSRGLWKVDADGNALQLSASVSDIQQLTNVGSTLFFSAYSNANGRELWQSDGTSGGTKLVKDINTNSGGAAHSNPLVLGAVGSTLYFAAATDPAGANLALWKTDGAAGNTAQVFDIRPGLPAFNKNFTQTAVLGNQLFFPAYDGTFGLNLWVTDGSPGGTHSVQNGNLRAPTDLLTFNGAVYVSAYPPDPVVREYQLFKTDGTDGGTSLVKSVDDPVTFTGLFSQSMTTLGKQFLFAGRDASNGIELWRSNGTAAGTQLLKDIRPGFENSAPASFTVLGGFIYFTADDGQHGFELWRSDGSAAGTTLVKDIFPDSSSLSLLAPQQLTVSGNLLYFSAEDGIHGRQLWKSDGTPGGTQIVKQFPSANLGSKPSEFVQFGDEVMFAANDGIHGTELWRSDGTSEGTALVSDLQPGGNGSVPRELTVFNGAVYFVADAGISAAGFGLRLWRTDSNGANPIPLTPLPQFSVEEIDDMGSLTVVGDTLYFTTLTSVAARLWKSDGTPGGTVPVFDFPAVVPEDAALADFFSSLFGALGSWGGSARANLQPSSRGPDSLTAVHGRLYFTVDDGNHGRELWTSDGTPGGTQLVKDITAGTGGAAPDQLINVNDVLFFRVGNGLWKSNGAEPGTTLVRSFASLEPGFAAIGDTVFFAADDGAGGKGLWKSDGVNTTLVADINPTGSSQPLNLTPIGDLLYFGATDGVHGTQVWQTDGTTVRRISKVRPASAPVTPAPAEMTIVGNELFFMDNDAVHGWELWATDGTEAGTVLVADIQAGAGASLPGDLIDLNGTLLFSAEDGMHGRELWKVTGVPDSPLVTPPAIPGQPPPAPPPPGTLPVPQVADLEITTFTVTPTAGTVGSNLTYTIVVTNHGPAALTGVKAVTDSFPSGTISQGLNVSQGSAVSENNAIRFQFGTLAPGASATGTITIVPTKAGDLNQHVHVTADQADTNTANNDASLTTPISLPPTIGNGIDLAISSFEASPDELEIGTDADYRIIIINQGDSKATGVLVTMELPAGATIFFGGTERGVGVIQIGNTAVFAMPDLDPGETALARMVLTLSQAGPAHAVADVSADENETNLGNNEAAVDVIVDPPPAPSAQDTDLAIVSYTASPDPAQSEHAWTHTAVVTNKSNVNTATNVRLGTLRNGGTESFLTATTSQGTYQQNGDFLEFQLGSLAPGASATVTFTYTIDLHVSFTLFESDEAIVHGAQPDPDFSNNIGRIRQHAILPAPADLEVTAEVAPDPASAGDNVTYTVTVINHGESKATNVRLSHMLPAEDDGAYVSAHATQGDFVQEGGALVFHLGDLDPDESATATITINTLRPAKLFTADIARSDKFDPNFDNNFAFIVANVLPFGSPLLLDKPDLEITTLTATPDPVTVGSNLKYTIVVTNRGGVTATGVNLTDVLPDSVNFLSATSTQGTVSRSGSTINVDLGRLEAAASATITILVTPTDVGAIQDQVGIAMNEEDPYLADNRASITTSVIPVPPPVTGADLQVTNVGEPDPVSEGSILSYTLTVTNHGPDAASGVVLTDTLPADAVYLAADSTQGNLSVTGNTVTFHLGTLLNGETATITIQVSAAVRGFFLNTATVASDVSDPNTENNLALEQIPVLPPGDTCAQLVADLNLADADAFDDPALGTLILGKVTGEIVMLDGIAYFTASDGIRGTELWRSDGTAAGTYLVKDINPNGTSETLGLKVIGDRLFFFADVGDGVQRQWVSDGTEAGTQLFTAGTPVADLNGTLILEKFANATTIELSRLEPGETTPTLYASIAMTATNQGAKLEVNGIVYFIFRQGTTGRELWRTDGTVGGTFKVKTLGAASSNTFFHTSKLFSVGSKIYFTEPDNSGNDDLWVTDGTEANTTLLHHFSREVSELTAFGGNLYFKAEANSTFGIWTSNGTVAGTTVVRTFAPAANMVSVPENLLVYHGALYFFLIDGSVFAGQPRNLQLWTSDGTSGGTALVKDLGVDPRAGSFTLAPMVFNDQIYFSFTDGANGIKLFVSDGTAAGTRKFGDLNANGGDNPGVPLVVGNRLYFVASDGIHGFELWQTDGTVLGTALVKDIAIGTNDAAPLYLGVLNDKALVLAKIRANDLGLFTTDGTKAGTELVVDLNSREQSQATLVQTGAGTSIAQVGNRVFFTTGSRLWVTDGTTGGTTLVHDFTGDPLGIQPDLLQGTSSRIFFITSTYSSGATQSRTLWTSDGTSAGTIVLKTMTNDPFNRTLTVVGNTAYFVFHQLQTGRDELWKSNGAAAGTEHIVFAQLDGSISKLVSYNGSLYFLGSVFNVGTGMYKSDGTPGGTNIVVRQLNNNDPHDIDGSITDLMVAGGKLYLRGNAFPGGVGNVAIWVSDGTRAGTSLLKAINPANPGASFLNFMSFKTNFDAFDGKVYFLLTDNSIQMSQIWVTDNTPAGTHKVADLPYSAGDRLLAAGDHVYFTAAGTDENGVFLGYELWQSDGTNDVSADHEVGTHIVHDVNPSALSGVPELNFKHDLNGIAYHDMLLFTVDDGFHGSELWKVDCPDLEADLAVFQSASPDNGELGDTVSYTLIVFNNGPDGAQDAVVTDTLPDNVTILSIATSQGRFTQNGNSVTFHLGDVIAGGSATVVIKVIPNAAGTLTNTARAFSSVVDPDTSNNSATTSVDVTGTPSADLSVELEASPAVVAGGDQVMYTFRVTNHGPNLATNVVLTETLPDGFTLSNLLRSQATTLPTDNTLRFLLGNLASGSTATASLVVTARQAGDFITTASVSAAEADPNPDDNTDTAETLVTANEAHRTLTTSTTDHATLAHVDLPVADIYHTRVIGLFNGTQTVFDLTTDHAPNSTEVADLFNQAATALHNAGATQVGVPTQIASTQSSNTVYDHDQLDHTEQSLTRSTSFGPGTIFIGEDQEQAFFIMAGTLDSNTNTHTESFTNQLYQTTVNHNATYQIQGSTRIGTVAKTYTVEMNNSLIVKALVGLLVGQRDSAPHAKIKVVLTSIHGLPSGHKLAVKADGSFTCKPPKNFTGPVQFTFQITDGTVTTGPVQVTLNVTRRGRQWNR